MILEFVLSFYSDVTKNHIRIF